MYPPKQERETRKDILIDIHNSLIQQSMEIQDKIEEVELELELINNIEKLEKLI